MGAHHRTSSSTEEEAGPTSGRKASGLRPSVRRIPKRPRPRVVVVLDQEETREMYAWAMRAAGWKVSTAATGQDALLTTASFEPDVVVMDLGLPDLDGLAVARLLSSDERTKRVPVVLCTGADRWSVEGAAQLAGCAALVTKPCPPEELRAVLEGVLAKARGSSSSLAG
jgi:DNA-binding response OmpR family regulator